MPDAQDALFDQPAHQSTEPEFALSVYRKGAHRLMPEGYIGSTVGDVALSHHGQTLICANPNLIVRSGRQSSDMASEGAARLDSRMPAHVIPLKNGQSAPCADPDPVTLG